MREAHLADGGVQVQADGRPDPAERGSGLSESMDPGGPLGGWSPCPLALGLVVGAVDTQEKALLWEMTCPEKTKSISCVPIEMLTKKKDLEWAFLKNLCLYTNIISLYHALCIYITHNIYF